MGRMFQMDSSDRILSKKPENIWAFSLINPIFDFVAEKLKELKSR